MTLSLSFKIALVVISFLFSVIVGIVAGLLKHTPTSPKAPAILLGGAALGGSMTLCLLLLTALGAF
ncbi:hypothetical protein [Streptomyces sp. NPDC054995]